MFLLNRRAIVKERKPVHVYTCILSSKKDIYYLFITILTNFNCCLKVLPRGVNNWYCAHLAINQERDKIETFVSAHLRNEAQG